MTSVDRTAYPVFPRLIMARELYTFFSPPEEEMEWVRGLTNTDEHQLAMAVLLKCHQRLSRFPKLAEVPEVIVDHVRRCLGLPETVVAVHASVRSAETHRKLIRRRVGAKYAPGKARKLAEAEMTRAAFVKNHPPDLINVALERLTQAGFELLAFSTLDAMESRVRGSVNDSIFRMIWSSWGRPGGPVWRLCWWSARTGSRR